MEDAALCGRRSTAAARFDCLTDVYRCLQARSSPGRRAAEAAAVIASGLGHAGPCASTQHRCDGTGPCASTVLTHVSLTLVGKMASALAGQELPPAVGLYFTEVLRMVPDRDLMPRLVHRFRSEDQILSHLAAKSASTFVVYRLHRSGAVSPVWQQKCVQAFHSSPPGPELDACLWSLTEVLKRPIKGCQAGILGGLLASFGSSLKLLCSKFLPEEGEKPFQCCTGSTHWGTTFCLLLDLLEVLTASGWSCGAGVNVKSLAHGLLKIVACCSQCFVKRRVLLLLKSAALQKAGEDWSLDVLLTAPERERFGSDASRLAQIVLTAVAARWLESLQVGSAAFFGGTRKVRDEGQTPDCVTLRAVSLLVLKSLQLHIQTAGEFPGACSAREVYGHLQCLLSFLRRHSVQLMELTHLCSWVSLLFGEQDDDMMEAAKALLFIFLYHRKYSGLDDVAVLEVACSFGCNPHCHFLLLLQSVCFDQSILLDFLISAETCFLEYFVRYLKYLRADVHGFRAASGRISASGSPLSQHKVLVLSDNGHMFPPTCKDEPEGAQSGGCVRPAGVPAPVKAVSLAAGLHLVQYDTSDESDDESLNDSTELLSSHAVGRPEGAAPNPAALSACRTSAQAVGCLSELRDTVTRLHTKKLFPYNASSLLKLLAQL
ncbi:protein Lines homolog 1 [Brachionichthys hirsutus]|uniref:protein Lines homolog 1 n=1 Tax=Brachionichthys hirsutus TaxID=412623 RepID=UPI00360545D8